MDFNANLKAITQTGLAPKVVDTVLSGNVLTMRLLGNGKKWVGEKLEKAVQVSKPVNGNSFAGLDSFPTSAEQTKQKLSFDVRAYVQSVVIPGIEKDVNASDPGRAALLVTNAMEEAGNAMLDSIGTIFYGDGTGNSNKDFLGLTAIIDDGTSVATYGGLSRSTYTTLKATRTSITGGLTSFSSLQAAANAVTYGTDTPTLYVTTKEKFSEFEALLQPTIQSQIKVDGYNQLTRNGFIAGRGGLNGQIGFNSLTFRGAPVVADDKCISDNFFGINERHIAWYGLESSHPDYKTVSLANKETEGVYEDMPNNNHGIAFSGLKAPYNQYGEVGFFVLLGNLVSFNPNRHFRLIFSA